MRIIANTIKKKIKKPRKKEKYIHHREPILNRKNYTNNFIKKYQEYTEDGKLAFIGVYKKVINEIQNERTWVFSTCRQYDNYVCRLIVRCFDPTKPFSAYSYEDFSAVLDELDQRASTKNEKESAQRLVRLIIQKAYDLGFTDCLSADIDSSDEAETSQEETAYPDRDETSEEVAQGKENADLIVFKPRSLTLSDALNVCRYLASKIDTNGEALGGLIMFLTGERTSESAGLLIRDYVTIGNRKYIARVNVMDQKSRNIGLGGKTNNAYRLIPVAFYLQEIIDRRIELLQEHFGGNNILSVPMICSGTNFKTTATQKEINAILKEAFSNCKVNENVTKAAIEFYSRDSDVQVESGGDLTAYIGRHQFLTDAYATGIPIEDLQLPSGHKVTDLYSNRQDQTNPDILKKITAFLDDRPLCRILDADYGTSYPKYSAIDSRFFSGDKFSIKLGKGNTYGIMVSGIEPGDFANVQITGGSVNAQIFMPSQPNINRGIVNRGILLPAARIKHFMESSDEEKIVDATSIFTPLRSNDGFNLSLAAKRENDIFAVPNNGKPVENTQKAETTLNIAQSDIVPKRFANLENVYVLLRCGEKVVLQAIDQSLGVIGDYGSEGIDLHLDGEPLGLYYISPTHHIYAHGEDSTIRQVEIKDDRLSLCSPLIGNFVIKRLTSFKKNERAKGLIALKTSGEIQTNRDIKGEPWIILNDDYQNKKIIDALFTCKRYINRDILIGTENGLGLRVSQAEICDYRKQLKKSAIKITEGDAPAYVIHYPEKKEEIIFVSESGALCKRGADILSAHNLGTQGQRLLPLGEKWIKACEVKPGDVLLLLGSNGKLLCLDTTELKKTSTPNSGKREGMVDSTICGAICVPMLKAS